MGRPDWLRLRREPDRRRHVLATVLALFCVLVAFLSLLAHAVGTGSQPVIIAASLAHYPMWLAGLGLLLAVSVRRWATAFLALVLSAIVAFFQVPAWIATSAPARGTDVTVMQANLRLGRADAQPIVDQVRTGHVDVLTTEELSSSEAARLEAAGLTKLLPHEYLYPSPPGTGTGVGIWSRYPLSDTQRYPGFALNVLRARVHLPGQIFTLFAVHLLPPYPYPPAEWTKELPRLGADLRAQPRGIPVVAAGDYNSTVDHAQFRAILTRGVTDGTSQAGAGYLPTYPGNRFFPPVIAIDHVLTRDAVVEAMHTVDLPNSDHRGLLAHVVLDRNG